MIFTVRKRDGREMPFNIEKISDAIVKAFRASGELNEQIKASQEQIDLLGHEDVLSSTALKVAAYAVGRLEAEGKTKPDIEEIQDAVEKALTDNNYADTAKSYILYRAERTRIREVLGVCEQYIGILAAIFFANTHSTVLNLDTGL